eukprot:gb/GFBE01063647.1/.p1 GENE.gb/GFBE01063647.1/~~gb/GFBE01063647.1/.p1  ORF type:complete len:174 (+),score=19.16 gb/GFBE01063647.1/:1-522(+)
MINDGIAPDSFTFSTLIAACADATDAEAAMSWLQKLEDRNLKLTYPCCGALIGLFTKEADPRQIMVIIGKMKSSGLTPRLIDYTSLMTACVRSGSPQDTEQVLQQMLAARVSPNVITLDVLSSALGNDRYSKLCEELDLLRIVDRDTRQIATLTRTGLEAKWKNPDVYRDRNR